MHTQLLTVANLAAAAGVPEREAFDTILASIPPGKRVVSPREVESAIQKAYASAGTFKPRYVPPVRTIPPDYFKTIKAAGGDGREVDLWELSPVRIGWEPGRDAIEALALLYAPDDILFIGDQRSAEVRPVSDWIDRLNSGFTAPHIMPNPVTGEPGLTKDGKPSFRADACIKSFRYAVAEFDNLARDEQAAFWCGWLAKGYPLAAVVDSGGKSLHGWVPVQCPDAATWGERVEQKLFETILVPLGVDRACKNEARLSRLPGHFRADKGRWQRILYINPAVEGFTL